MDTDASGAELAEHECWARLRSLEVGRLAVVVDGRPDIFPVNYVVDHGSIVFRSAPGSKLAAIAEGSPVAFEADGEADGLAFSVVLKGTAVEVDDRYEDSDPVDLPLYPWHGTHKPIFVRLAPDVVTGRCFEIADRRSSHPSHDSPTE